MIIVTKTREIMKILKTLKILKIMEIMKNRMNKYNMHHSLYDPIITTYEKEKIKMNGNILFLTKFMFIVIQFSIQMANYSLYCI